MIFSHLIMNCFIMRILTQMLQRILLMPLLSSGKDCIPLIILSFYPDSSDLAKLRHDNVHKALIVIPKWKTPTMMVYISSDNGTRLSSNGKLSSLSFGSPQETDRATHGRGQTGLDGFSHFRQRLALDGVDQKVFYTIMQAWPGESLHTHNIKVISENTKHFVMSEKGTQNQGTQNH